MRPYRVFIKKPHSNQMPSRQTSISSQPHPRKYLPSLLQKSKVSQINYNLNYTDSLRAYYACFKPFPVLSSYNSSNRIIGCCCCSRFVVCLTRCECWLVWDWVVCELSFELTIVPPRHPTNPLPPPTVNWSHIVCCPIRFVLSRHY